MKKYIPGIFITIIFICLIFFGLMLLKKNRNDFNIILISIDTLRADHLSCYKYNKNTTPFIDKFRKDSILFRKCIAQSASTLASHASILTSLIPSHHRAYFTRSQPLPEKIQTMAELLHRKNYRTVSINDGGQIAPEFGLNQGFEIYESMGSKFKHDNLNFIRIVNKATEWLHNNSDEKFFLFLHTYETHLPYNPKMKYLKLFESNYHGKLPTYISRELIKQINDGKIKINDDDKKHIIYAYDAEIRSMDESFGVLIDVLKKKRLYERTLIIFTSDHGEELGERGIWAQHSHTLFKELINVPLIIKLPMSKFGGRKVNKVVRSIDILPTVMDLLDEKMTLDFEGISLVSLMKGQKAVNEIFAISQRDMLKTLNRKYWSIIYGKWKLYDSKLYDLVNDPTELVDVSESNKNLYRRLERFAINFIKKNKNKFSKRKIVLDRELKNKLKSLGYLD